ncbi:MAG: PEP-CTERM sorting domain-containing protein [Pirellulales bacterium]|nr:PEP-CTERM sorting domain-containing protein [Pirellulales bacterium]
MMSCKQILSSIVALTLMAAVAMPVFAGTAAAPSAMPGYGDTTLSYADMNVVGSDWGSGQGYQINDLGGNSFSFGNNNSGGEWGAYYAFEVPSGAGVSISSGTWVHSGGGTSYWGEALMWSADDLDGPMTGLNGMTMADWEGNVGGSWSTAGVTGRWDAYTAGYDYFYHSGGAPTDQFTAVWNYAANSQHFLENGTLTDFSGGATKSGFTAWGSSPGHPTTTQNISAWTYTDGGSLDRCMQDPDAPSTGFPAWMTQNSTGANAQVAVMMKVGGGNYSLLTVNDLTIEIRGAGDANGYSGGEAACDVSDLGILAANYGQAGVMDWEDADFNGDGTVDVSDLGILAGNYGTVYIPSTAAVPEPSMLCLLVLGSLAMIMIRRR